MFSVIKLTHKDGCTALVPVCALWFYLILPHTFSLCSARLTEQLLWFQCECTADTAAIQWPKDNKDGSQESGNSRGPGLLRFHLNKHLDQCPHQSIWSMSGTFLLMK